MKLRILCLHGYTQNATLFSRKTGAFRKKLSDVAEFHFLSAPHVLTAEVLSAATGAPSVSATQVLEEAAKTDEATARTWWTTLANGVLYADIRESVSLIEREMETHGPFDGILGYSQGAAVSGVLSSLASMPLDAEDTSAATSESKSRDNAPCSASSSRTSSNSESTARSVTRDDEDGVPSVSAKSPLRQLKFAIVACGFRPRCVLLQQHFTTPTEKDFRLDVQSRIKYFVMKYYMKEGGIDNIKLLIAGEGGQPSADVWPLVRDNAALHAHLAELAGVEAISDVAAKMKRCRCLEDVTDIVVKAKAEALQHTGGGGDPFVNNVHSTLRSLLKQTREDENEDVAAQASELPSHVVHLIEKAEPSELAFRPSNIALPSFHLLGERDAVVPPERGLQLASSFENPTVVFHKGGHYIPHAKQEVEQCLQFLMPFWKAKNEDVVDRASL